MKSWTIAVFALVIALFSVAACTTSETPIPNNAKGIQVLVSALQSAGASVTEGDSITQPFFDVAGKFLTVNGNRVEVFEYADPGEAQAEAAKVAPDGGSVGTTSIMWVAPPHFYLSDTLLVLYVGNDGAVIDLLQSVLGPQFAGGALSDGVTEPPVDPDAKVQAYLALMNELAMALRRVVTSVDQQGSIDQVLVIASQLEEYVGFFAALDEEHMSKLLTTYGEQISETSNLTARLAVAATAATGADSIALALQRTPAFAIASVTIGESTQIEGREGLGAPIMELREVPSGDISTLLLPDEVAALAGALELTVQYRDQKSAAAAVDPAQVEKIDIWYGLTFEAADGTKGMTFSVIDFDSESSALDHYGTMTSEPSGLQEMSSPIGEASAQVEVNAQGIGSILVFLKGDKVISLHTAQPEGQEPLLSLESLEELAKLVASRL